MLRRRCFHGINALILMPHIFDVTANENARYKRNELECNFIVILFKNTSSQICEFACICRRFSTVIISWPGTNVSYHRERKWEDSKTFDILYGPLG